MRKNVIKYIIFTVLIFACCQASAKEKKNKLTNFSACNDTIAKIKDGINKFRSNALYNGTTPVVPADLDTIQTYPTTCGNRVNSSEFGPCFEFILENPVTSNWVKAAAATYTWSPAIGGESRITCVYDFITGNFTCL